MASNPSHVTVAENAQGRYQQSVEAGAHHLIADEPLSMGGADAGPAPFEYLLAALGACTSMTLRMYAELKQLPLTHVAVFLTHEKVDAEGGRKIDRINRQITLEGDLTQAQRQRMLEIANRCPVHRAITGNLEIDSSLAEVAGASAHD